MYFPGPLTATTTSRRATPQRVITKWWKRKRRCALGVCDVHPTTARHQCHGSAIESTTDSHPQQEGGLAATNDMAYAAQSGLPKNGLLWQNWSTTATAEHSVSAAAKPFAASRDSEP